jgi:hypothetical protein
MQATTPKSLVQIGNETAFVAVVAWACSQCTKVLNFSIAVHKCHTNAMKGQTELLTWCGLW